MQEPAREQAPLRVWEMILGTILYPSEAFLDVAQQRPVGSAIGLIFISSILGYRVESLLTQENQFPISGMISSALYELFSFVVFVGLVHVIGRRWYDKGDYSGALCTLAFAQTPSIFFALLSLLLIPFGLRPPRPSLWGLGPGFDPAAGILMLLLALATLIWIVILSVIAIRSHYDLENGQAMIIYILASAVHIVIFWLLGGMFQ